LTPRNFYPWCVGMPALLSKMGPPERIKIDLDKNSKAFSTYRVNKYFGNLLIVGILSVLIIYLMGDHLKSLPLETQEFLKLHSFK